VVKKINGKEVLFVSFSGGRTSAYMCWWLINNKSDQYHFIFVFANTGLEHEKTLDFVHRCAQEWGFNVVWLEAVVHHGEKKGCSHKVVSYDTAARSGEPFIEVIKKYGIPNKSYPHCNRELKLNPMFSYKRSLGFASNHSMAVGIRIDEIDRVGVKAKEHGVIHPLISMQPTTKAEVRHWWSDQPFDLDLPEHLGNCVTCWKKSTRKLMTIAKHAPHYFTFNRDMEREHSTAGAGEDARVFFRENRSTQDIFDLAGQPFNEFVDYMPELQMGLVFDIDALDREEDCGGSCDIAA